MHLCVVGEMRPLNSRHPDFGEKKNKTPLSNTTTTGRQLVFQKEN